MEWIEIAKSVAELGIMTIIAGVFLYQGKKDRDKQQLQNDKIFATQMEQNKQVFSKMLEATTGVHVLTEDEDKHATEIDKTIDGYLQHVVNETDSTRAFVMRYHNGGRDMACIPFLRMSMTNEVVDVGVKPIMQDYQSQFRSSIAIICEGLDTIGQSYISDIEMIRESDAGTYEMLKGRGVKAVYCKPLRSLNEHIIGFIGITYMNDNKHTQNLEIIDESLCAKARNISALLNLEIKEK